MKKLFLFIIPMVAVILSKAQIPNADFETWIQIEDYEAPESWMTSDMEYSDADQTNGSTHTPSIEKENTAASGSYAIKVQNSIVSLSSAPVDTLPGYVVAMSGPSYKSEGFAFTERPISVSGFYKFTSGSILPEDEIAAILVSFSKWNFQTQSRDSLGGTVFVAYENTSSFKDFSSDIDYVLPGTPDSAHVSIYCGIGDKHYAGTSFTVDQLAFVGVTGTKIPLINENGINIFPNPASDFLNLNNIPAESSYIEISDLNGNIIKQIMIETTNERFSITGLPEGVYNCVIKNETGIPLCKGKLVVKK